MRWRADRLPDLDGRVAVVTGANSGIGWHVACALAAHRARVVLACRDPERGAAAVARIRSELAGSDVRAATLDLASMESVRGFAGEWHGPLDLLVNNAGVMAPPRRARTADGFELQFGTNHLGHFVLTGLLLPALLESGSGRVVTVSSVAHHGGDAQVVEGNAGPDYHPQRTYSNSKLANLLFADELDRQARRHGAPLVSVAAHPGVAATGLATDPEGMGASRIVRLGAPVVLRLFTQSARAGARAVVFAATEAEPGSYTGPQRWGETRGRIGPARRSALAQDERLARRLWHASEELTGFHYSWPARAATTTAHRAE
jgi:NAD(P)-dependent dehydrogenase (short-subunit alcohol dehydrogenase family)